MSRDLVKEEADFPLAGYDRAAAHLRRPFTAGAVKFKVQSTFGDQGMIVSYIDARLVFERLNLVVPHLWHDAYERLDGQWIRCDLTIGDITRSDVGTGKDLKAMWSDAVKRAGVHFGIGVSTYAMSRIWLQAGKGRGDLTKKTKNGKETLGISADCETHLRGLYDAWLATDAGQNFGPPLDHGDPEEGSVGELADTTDAPAADEPYEDPAEAEQHAARILQLWEDTDWQALPAKNRIPKSRLDAMLSGANGNGDLDSIEAHVREKAGSTA